MDQVEPIIAELNIGKDAWIDGCASKGTKPGRYTRDFFVDDELKWVGTRDEASFVMSVEIRPLK